MTITLDTSVLLSALTNEADTVMVQSWLPRQDAFHLAVCADVGAALCTLDRRLGEAALMAGVACVSVGG